MVCLELLNYPHNCSPDKAKEDRYKDSNGYISHDNAECEQEGDIELIDDSAIESFLWPKGKGIEATVMLDTRLYCKESNEKIEYSNDHANEESSFYSTFPKHTLY